MRINVVNEKCLLRTAIKSEHHRFPKFVKEFKNVKYVPPIDLSQILKKKALRAINGIVPTIVSMTPKIAI